MMNRFYHLIPIIAVLLVMQACAGPAELVEAEADAAEETVTLKTSSLLGTEDLNSLRPDPNAHFISLNNQIPDAFMLSEDDIREINSNQGFRIQLLNTDNVAKADSVSNAYYDWAYEYPNMPFELVPESYITFRQPNYRVRVGDFRTRSSANEFLQIVRNYFPGAWVVIDTIDPELTPR
ncbi:MAG: SPOR domain-containing protein [Balneolales bacterium]|nr:SPOR domain-containing protein [Balneolales bacterium]